MPTSQPSAYNGTLFPTRESAIEYLNNYTKWSIGKFFTVLYRKNDQNTSSNVCVIVAVGIKNASECGPMGQYSADVWENKFYPSGAYGPEFYTIIKDSGEDESSFGGDIVDVNLNETEVTVNGDTYIVANQEGKNQSIPDPFAFRKIPYEKE